MQNFHVEELTPQEIPKDAQDRYQLWCDLLNRIDVKTMAEIGVWKGVFCETDA